MNGISALLRRDMRESLSLLSEDTTEDVPLQARKMTLTRALILDFPVFRIVRNKCVSFKPPSL